MNPSQQNSNSLRFFSLLSCLTLCGLTSRIAMATPLEDARPKGFTRAAHSTDVLIFQGTATAYGDAEAIDQIVTSHGLTDRIVNESDMSTMSVDDLAKFGVIVWPGGYAGQMSDSLTQGTRDAIHSAVKERGVGFVGFCAGSFIAVTPDTKWGFSLIQGQTLPYYHLEDEGTEDAMTPVQMADGSTHDLVWWGGPKLPEWTGGVIARYADTKEPAIAQTWAGNGFMILSGPHPEAPESWRTKLSLDDTDGLDQDIALQMIQAAMTQKPMLSL